MVIYWHGSYPAPPVIIERETMPDLSRHGVVEKLSLSDAELADIRALADACTRYEDTDLRLSWGALRSLVWAVGVGVSNCGASSSAVSAWRFSSSSS